MKKLIAIFLSLALLFSLAACGNGETSTGSENTPGGSSSTQSGVTGALAETVFAETRVKNTSGGVSVENDLSNTYYKLKNNKKLTIGYTGGSVTDGSGGTNGYCWRTAVTQWFKDNYPEAEIKEADGSQGNKSSLWGFFRIDDWVKKGQEASLIDMKPDLVFLEFAINDYYVRMSEQRTIHYMEGMINKIRNALPETDIVIVFITDEGFIGKELPTVPPQRELAAHYGIPVIDVGAAMNEHLKSTGKAFKEFFTDNVHPNNDGYKVYADAICEFLEKKFATANATGVKKCEMPKNWLLTNGSCNSEMIVASKVSEIADVSDWKLLDSPGNAVSEFGPQLYGTDDSVLEFEFEGTGISLMVDAPLASVVRSEIDGKEQVVAQVANSIHNELLVVENLAPGKHKIKMRIIGKRFILGAILIEK